MKRLLRFLCLMCLMTVTTLPVRATNLPTGYTELEYVNMQSGSYLLTDIVPQADYKIEFEFKLNAFPSTGSTIMGTRPTGAGGSGMQIAVNQDGVFTLDGLGTRYSLTTTASLNTLYKYTWDNKTATITSGTTIIGTTTFTGTQTQEYPLAINTLNNVGGFGTPRNNIHFYGFKVWNAQGQLIADYVPAKYGNSVGVYDMVSNTFKTATSGTFTAGPIACNGTRVNYTTATGTVTQSGTPTPTNPIEPVFYKQGDMILRKVGDVFDSYDATKGKITRRIGKRVLNGTENWEVQSGDNTYFYLSFGEAMPSFGTTTISTHFPVAAIGVANNNQGLQIGRRSATGYRGAYIRWNELWVASSSTLSTFKQWLSEHPVTVYYTLPEADYYEEYWDVEQCVVHPITIATTKYTEDAFAGLMTTLSEAITKVTNIVDTTVQQATEIGNLATTKQDRPDTDCPAGRKCLLIMGADNKPHWYLIQE